MSVMPTFSSTHSVVHMGHVSPKRVCSRGQVEHTELDKDHRGFFYRPFQSLYANTDLPKGCGAVKGFPILFGPRRFNAS